MESLSKSATITFCTSSKHKLQEARSILKGIATLQHADVELNELQGSPSDISKFKCKEAYNLLKSTVLVEDTCLCLNALNGLPGPYIKWFVTAIGPEGIVKMLEGFEDKSAYALCSFSIYDGEGEPLTFEGRVDGKIVAPRGPRDFGWDPIFQPSGFEQTFAEMDKSVKNSISHRFHAMQKLLAFLKGQG